jgi:hypothetical protein
VDYVYPQESGGRADAAWVSLSDGAGGGLSFVCTAAPVSKAAAGGGGGAASARPALALFSASRAGWRAVQEAARPYQVPAIEARHAAAAAAAAGHDGGSAGGGVVHVHLDAAHMGVGSDDSWSPSVHDAYLVPPGEYAFGVALLPAAAAAAAGAAEAP